MKPRWLKAVCILSGIITGVIMFAYLLRPGEPMHQGQPLSYWVDQLDKRYRGPIEAAENAVRAIGPKATPFLLERVRRETSANRRFWANVWRSKWFPGFAKRIIPAPKPYNYGLPGKTVYFLQLLGPEVVPDLIPAIKDKNTEIRRIALQCIGMGTNLDGVAPAVIDCLNDPEDRIRRIALELVGRFGQREANLVVPALIRLLSEQQLPANARTDLRDDAARALAQIGPQAADAIPQLTKLLGDSNPAIRQAAAVAVWEIQPDPTAIQFLSNELDKCQDAVIARQILQDFGNIGAAAIAAVPAILRTIARSDSLRNSNGTDTRAFGHQALARIVPETEISIRMQDLRAALRNKDSQDYVRCREILSAVAQMGEAAKPTLSTLLEIAKNPGQTWSDYERTSLSKAAAEAVQKIDPQAAEELEF